MGKECGRIAAEPSNDPNETLRHQPTELSFLCLQEILATCDRLTRSAGLSYSCGLDACAAAALTWLQGAEMVRPDAAWRGLPAPQG
jgi:hypothetical protein